MTSVDMEQAPKNLWRDFLAVALAEMRSARRLARTWLFGALALIFGVLSYVYYAVIHGFFSGMSGSIGLANPRFLMPAIGAFLMWLFLVAMIFLAFDVRARDTRDRMAEVLDTRPLDNLTMLAGRLVGLVIVVWVPLLLMALAMQGLGGLLRALDLQVGEMIEPRSLLAFVFVDAPTGLVLWGSLVMLLAVVLRNRLAVVLVALALCGLQLYGLYQTPAYLAPALSGFAAYSQIASDLLPYFVSATDVVQRGCLLLAAAGMIALVAALHLRRDRQARSIRIGAGAGLLVLGAVGIASLAWRAEQEMALRGEWLAHHQAHQDAPAPTLDHVAGEVTIDVDAGLEIALDYTLTPPSADAQTLHFALNPGMTVRALRVAGEEASFEHARGLLQVQVPAAARGKPQLALSLAANGVPDAAFAYLDSAIDLARGTATEGAALSLLGFDACVFDDRYVALMPAAFLDAAAGRGGGRRGSAAPGARLLHRRFAGANAPGLAGGRTRSARRGKRPVSFSSSSAGAGGGDLRLPLRAPRHRGGRCGAGALDVAGAHAQRRAVRGRRARAAGTAGRDARLRRRQRPSLSVRDLDRGGDSRPAAGCSAAVGGWIRCRRCRASCCCANTDFPRRGSGGTRWRMASKRAASSWGPWRTSSTTTSPAATRCTARRATSWVSKPARAAPARWRWTSSSTTLRCNC